jgi:hypothetical protein
MCEYKIIKQDNRYYITFDDIEYVVDSGALAQTLGMKNDKLHKIACNKYSAIKEWEYAFYFKKQKDAQQALEWIRSVYISNQLKQSQ